MVEVYEADAGDAGAGEGCGGVGAYAAEADDYDEGGAEFGEAGGGEEDFVAGELLVDEVCWVGVSGRRWGCWGKGV